MATIHYTKTFFQSPSHISEDTYYSIKQELAKNPNFIIAEGETFSEHFSGLLTIIKIGLGASLLFVIAESLGMSERSVLFNLLAFCGGIGFLAALVCGFNLMLEGPSFATYVKERDEYFSRMRYAIINSNTYNEFVKMFY